MLKTIGLWPQGSQNSCQIIKPKLRRLCNLVTLLFMLIPNLVSLIKVNGDMVLMIDNLQYSMNWMMTLLKVCIIWYKQEALAPLIDMIEKDWTKVKKRNQRDVMLRYARITRAIATCGLLAIFTGLIISVGPSGLRIMRRYMTNLNESEKSLPVPTYYPHDISKSPQFELTLLAQVFAIFFAATSYCGIDNLLGLLVLHVCGQLENLHSRLIYIEKYSNFDAVLKYNVQDHIRLIRFIKIVDDTFYLMLLSLVLYFAILFGLQGFLIVNVLHQKSQISIIQLSLFVLMIGILLGHMYLYCAVGEILVTRSGKIHHATYEYAWYSIESKAAKNFIIIMLRANKPLYITAGKIFPMTMATFCSLLKTSASYISMLLAYQD